MQINFVKGTTVRFAVPLSVIHRDELSIELWIWCGDGIQFCATTADEITVVPFNIST